jgi:putative DeoR family transcriptional regulator (stage III sporulation protein D)
LKQTPNDRAVDFGHYIVATNATVRATAAKFGISKSTVHKDVTERLPKISPALFSEVQKVLEINKSERHIRGGLATKKKYQEINKKRK